jgi:succinate dehydrogenase hydrophobic anchor subunit
MAKSISARIAGDRAISGFFAFVASLPATAAMLGMAWVGYRFVTDEPEQFQEDGGYLMLAMLALFAFLFFIVARWTYDAVQAGLTPQRVQAMWLRRFHSESGGAFRTSRVIDRLSRHGVAALTLQDRDVRLSYEQRRNRLAPMFWLLFIPITLLLGFALWQAWQGAQADIMDMPEAETIEQSIGQIFGAFVALIAIAAVLILAAFFGLFASLVLVMLLAAIAGPVGAMFTKNRDDFESLPKLLQRIERGKGRRGAEIVRVSDTHWREAVCSSLAAVDVAIIDLSDVSDHVAWEIGEAVKACGASGLVFICSDAKGGLTNAARAAVRRVLGREPGNVVFYPARRGSGDPDRFARQLRAQIYDAADLSGAMKA